MCIFSSQAADVVADVAGFFPAGSGYVPITNPTRILDTRTSPLTDLGPNSPTLFHISCPSVTVCVTTGTMDRGVSDVVMATFDGGATWTSPTPPVQVGSGERLLIGGVACSTTSICVAVGFAAQRNDYYTQRPLIARSVDGGRSWSPAAVPAGVFALDAVTCRSSGTCLAVGVSTNVHGVGVVLQSLDNGQSWAVSSLGPGGAGYLTAVSCGSATVCYATGRTSVSPLNDFLGSAFLKTMDGGTSWTRVGATGEYFGNSEIHVGNISCGDEAHCTATGSVFVVIGIQAAQEAYAATTNDGGTTWSSISNPPLPSNEVDGIDCVSAARCYMAALLPVGQRSQAQVGVVWRTAIDGPWTTKIALDVPSNPPIQLTGDVSCPTIDVCFAAGGGSDHTGFVLRLN